MPKLKFKADQLAPLAVSVSLFPLLPPCFASSSRTVTIQLDLKFDYKMPSTKCAIGKHFPRARVWNLFWPTNNFSHFFFFFGFCSATVRNCNGFQIVLLFAIDLLALSQSHILSLQRKFPTAEYDEYNSPLINTIPPPPFFILCVTTVTARFIIT